MKKHTSHSIVLQAMCLHGLRWEPFQGDKTRGELCFNGLRHATQLDHLGCPILTPNLLATIVPIVRGFKNQPPA